MSILHQNANYQSYKFFTWWIFGLWFLYLLFDPITGLAQYPPIAYKPTGFLLRFLPQPIYYLPISYTFLLTLKLTLLLCFLCVIMEKGKKWAALAACPLLSVYQGLARSFGHVNHPELMFVTAVFVFTIFFFFEDTIEQDAKTKEGSISPYGIPLIALLFVFCFTYAFAGVHRLVVCSTEIYFNDTIIQWIVENGNRARFFSWNLEGLVLEYPWMGILTKIGFPLVTIYEVLAPFCFVSRRFRYSFIAVMLPFHLLIWMFMGIFFWSNFALAILLFDFSPLFSKNHLFSRRLGGA